VESVSPQYGRADESQRDIRETDLTRLDQCEPLAAAKYRMREILVAAAIQGAIFATVKAVINRGGARAFQRLTGEWPGD
jgi:hypothetical protein